MAIQRTRWRPDTCECSIEYEWDDAVASDVRTHTTVAVVPCPVHTGLSVASAGAAVVRENQGKNLALGIVRQQRPELVDVNLEQSWTGTGEGRVLTIRVPTVTGQVRTQLQQAVDSSLGNGRILIRG